MALGTVGLEEQPSTFQGQFAMVVLWPPDAKSQPTGREPDGKDWRQEEKGMTKDEMARWH